MILSSRISLVMDREVPESQRLDVLEVLEELDESIFENEDLDRIAAVILILYLEGVDLGVIADVAERDWRDLLLDAGLEGADWGDVLARRFGFPRDFSGSDGG